MKEYPLIVIGGGTAAFAAATKANDLRRKALKPPLNNRRKESP